MITYTNGRAIEHLHYLPYGETQVDQRATSYAARYTFSAKEKDEETGYSYFGARYYNSDLSVWLSVDPMSDKYPSTSPYTYCNNKPLKLIDTNGMSFINIIGDPPPKNNQNFFQKGWNKFVAFDRSLEGHSDGANQGTITNQDVVVATSVVGIIVTGGAALEAGSATATSTAITLVGAANNIDDAFSDASGQSATQRATQHNPVANKAVNIVKTASSIVSCASSTKFVIKQGLYGHFFSATDAFLNTANAIKSTSSHGTKH